MISIFSPSVLILFLLLLSNQLFAQSSVAISDISKSDIDSELHLSGNVVAQSAVNISSEVSAIVDKVLVEAGDTVAEGQKLIQLRQVRAGLELDVKRAEVKGAMATLKIATIEEKRLRSLLETKSVSLESYDQAVARLQESEASLSARKSEVALLEDSLDRHIVRAPFEGVVVSREAEKGAWAVLGETLLRLESHNNLRIEVAVPEKYYAQIKDRKNSIDAVAGSNQEAKGEDEAGDSATVARILPFTDTSRNFDVWIDIDNRSGKWIPGMTAQTILRWRNVGRYPLSVSRDAIVRSVNGDTVVWKVVQVEDNQWSVVPIAVKIGSGSRNNVAIQSRSANGSDALKEGDSVVVRGNENLRDGQVVKPVKLSSSVIE